MKTFRTQVDHEVSKRLAEIFLETSLSTEDKLSCFPKYVPRINLKRFLILYELYKKVLPVKGSVVDCGVYRGFSFTSWIKLGSILEPENFNRRVYGFDSFEGFTNLSRFDSNRNTETFVGDLSSDSELEIKELIKVYDQDRVLGHIPRAEIIKGDVRETIPNFIEENPHIVISLLFLDLDLYEPTKVALENLVPRMSKGSLLVFDELDNPQWPGETLALLHSLGIRNVELKQIENDPYISYVTL